MLVMSEQIFNIGFLENFKVFIVAILIYAIIYSVLKTVKPFGDNKSVDAVIALVSAIIVSFSGVISYSVSYAINWFVILFFILFLLLVLLMFLGIKPEDIASVSTKNAKPIIIAFIIVFSVIILKSFFALNNAFDTSNPQNDSYAINTTMNTGFGDVASDSQKGFFGELFANVDRDLLSAVLFLVILGIFIMFI